MKIKVKNNSAIIIKTGRSGLLFPVFVIESKLLFTDKVSILINNKKRWRRNMPKGKTTVFFVRNVVTNHQSGWDSVLHVRNGIHLLRR